MFYPVQLDKTRNFRYGMKAISLLEKKFKKPMSAVDFSSLTMEDTATLIWAGLQHEDDKLTAENVMDLVDNHSNLQAVIAVMGEALNASFGTQAKTDKEETEKNA